MKSAVSSSRLVIASALLIPSLLCAQDNRRGRKYKPPPPTSNITVTVTKASDGKPVQDAAVVFHPINDKGKDEGGMELKTDENGKASLNVIPIGDTLLLQVIAPGYQTFGFEYPVKSASKDITVKLRYPAAQYSIYQKHPNGEIGGPKPEEKRAKPANVPPGTTD